MESAEWRMIVSGDGDPRYKGGYQQMGLRVRSSRVGMAGLEVGTDMLAKYGTTLARIHPVREALVRATESSLASIRDTALTQGFRPPGVDWDRYELGMSLLHSIVRVLEEDRVSPATRKALFRIIVRNNLFLQGSWEAKEGFKARNGCYPPDIMLMSPGKGCNLKCTGCYADSGATREKLHWDTLTRLIGEAHDLLGNRLFAFSGGEPLSYHSEGKGVLDIAERYPDSLFIMYTNATLIDDDMAKRMGELGNITPAISVEGLRGPTEERRGKGVFDRILAAMERLRREKVLFGMSLTATRLNSDDLLSDRAVEFYFDRHGASYAWIFHYMPIGRSITLDLMPTPEQRARLWKRSWELIRNRRLFIADFWNMATVTDGCISAGREGGYWTVDWNGAVMPCVFFPYAAANINEAYANGETIEDIWARPFFAGIREWQKGKGFHGPDKGDDSNWLMPCPMRDCHADGRRLLLEHEPEPQDENAREALNDPDYAAGLMAYDSALEKLTRPTWEEEYVREGGRSKGSPAG